MTTARLNVLHAARQSQNPAPRSALFLFNLDRWVFSSYNDPADQIMVMVVIAQKADGGGGFDDETIDDFSFTDNSEVASVSDCVNHLKDQNDKHNKIVHADHNPRVVQSLCTLSTRETTVVKDSCGELMEEMRIGGHHDNKSLFKETTMTTMTLMTIVTLMTILAGFPL